MRSPLLNIGTCLLSLVALTHCGGIANLGTPATTDGGSSGDAGAQQPDSGTPSTDSGKPSDLPIDNGTNYFARFAMNLAYFNKSNVCAAHKQADGNYKWENVYAAADLTPTDLAPVPATDKPLTRYFELTAKPDGFLFQASSACPAPSKTAPESAGGFSVASTARYITVITVPFSGEAPQTQVFDDNGPNLPAPLGASLRVVNASSYDTDGIESQIVAKDGTTSALSASAFLGPSAAFYTNVPSGLARLNINATDSNPASSTSLLTLRNDAYTAYVLGFEGQRQLIVCRDGNTTPKGAKLAFSDCVMVAR